jgi:hypothetical protein
MNTLITSESSAIDAVTPVSPRPMGRPSGYSEETVGMLCEAIRRRGMSDTAAALTLGIGRSTLSGWKKEHPELEEWLAMAREQFRESKLAIVDEAKTKDGRPEWRAAIWSLEKAFPEDYGKPPRPRWAGAGGGMGWMASASVLENAFPDEFGGTRLAGRPGAGPGLPGPDRELVGALIEENEELRAQLRALIPES